MNIGLNIKKLRRERDITQEQLAEYLNISVSAISQWECGKTAPDISLLASLANIFEVSADLILGINIDIKEKRIQEILNQAEKYHRNGYNINKARETLRAGLNEYPNSSKIMNNLMSFIYYEIYDDNKTGEEQKEPRSPIKTGGCGFFALFKNIKEVVQAPFVSFLNRRMHKFMLF